MGVSRHTTPREVPPSALSDTAIRTAKPTEKPYKLADEKGLFLLISPNGSKYWRLKFRIDGKEKLLSFGVYPDTGLKETRAKRDEARKLLAAGIDPSENKKAQKSAKVDRSANSFEVICREWLEDRKGNVEPAQTKKTLARMENDVFPWLGGRPITDISPNRNDSHG